jgi:hypothetical protein
MARAQARKDTSAQVGNAARNTDTVVFQMHIAMLVVRQSSADVTPKIHQHLPGLPAQTTPAEASMATSALTIFAVVSMDGAAKALVIAKKDVRVCSASVRRISFLLSLLLHSRHHSTHVSFV